ncbi:class I SAM-dependent methyltransferase [Pseudomonadota bacterium]
MALTTCIKQYLNKALRPLNIKLDSWTVNDLEMDRIRLFEETRGFDTPVYAFSPGMEEYDAKFMSDAYKQYQSEIDRLKIPQLNDTGYSPGNNYFDSPDVEALYCIVRYFKPSKVIEVGCGNSTRVTRQAVIDGGQDTEMIAIDPYPRADISHLVDRFEQARLESLHDQALFTDFKENDILFIDSSHEVRTANDVAHLFCRIIPVLVPGVIIHVHDIFLPFEYPQDMAFPYPSWGEQYILHALLSGGGYEILWPGHYVQNLRQDLHGKLPFLAAGRAQSFWIRKTR